MLTLISLGIALLTTVYLWLTWNYNHWKRKGVPQLEPKLFFGSLKDLFLMKYNMAIIYDNLYKKMPDEPAVGIYRLRQPQLLVRDPEMFKLIMIKEFSSFHDNDIDMDPECDPVFGYNPFVIKGEEWKKARSITTSALTLSKIKSMVEHITVACKEMVQYLKKNENKILEAKMLGGHFTTDVVTGCVYGLSSSTFQDPESIYRKMITKSFDLDWMLNIKFAIINLAPWLAKLIKLRFFPHDVEMFFTKIVSDSVEYRKKNSVQRNDFLQQLIDQSGKNGNPAYSMKEIMAHSMTFIIDGYETSSVLICHCLDYLSQHPEVQDKLREELRPALSSLSKLSFDLIHSFQYLDAVINETLRIRPPASVLLKRCTRNISLDHGGRQYPVEKGTSVALPIYSIQKDSRYFEEPDVFKPERFIEQPNPPAFFPFGLGPRACLGSRFALTQVKACIAAIVTNFEIIPDKIRSGPIEYMGGASIFLLVKGGVNVKFKSL